MDRIDIAGWSRLWADLKLHGDSHLWHSRLFSAYSEPHRQYHNLQHLAECLTVFDSLEDEASDPLLVEVALWFHDVVYDPRAVDNEERSADLARICLVDAGMDSEGVEHVVGLILATKRHVPASADARVVCDADLAILGQLAGRFWEYENAIAQEYSWVPADTYRVKRVEVLETFLSRDVLYHTAGAHSWFEQQARANLTLSIARLRTST